MGNPDDLDIITTDEDWINLRAGEQALVRGKIDQNKEGDHKVLITFPWDWSSLSVEVSNRQGLHREFPLGSSVEVKVTRTLDGLSCVSQDITLEEEKKNGR